MQIKISYSGLFLLIISCVLLGVVLDSGVASYVMKQQCHAQRETKKLQVASKAQAMVIPAAFNPRDPAIIRYLPKLPAKALKQ